MFENPSRSSHEIEFSLILVLRVSLKRMWFVSNLRRDTLWRSSENKKNKGFLLSFESLILQTIPTPLSNGLNVLLLTDFVPAKKINAISKVQTEIRMRLRII